jgi:hypothetical protein
MRSLRRRLKVFLEKRFPSGGAHASRREVRRGARETEYGGSPHQSNPKRGSRLLFAGTCVPNCGGRGHAALDSRTGCFWLPDCSFFPFAVLSLFPAKKKNTEDRCTVCMPFVAFRLGGVERRVYSSALKLQPCVLSFSKSKKRRKPVQQPCNARSKAHRDPRLQVHLHWVITINRIQARMIIRKKMIKVKTRWQKSLSW